MKLKALSSEDLNILKRAFKYAKPYTVKLILLLICILSTVGFGLLEPLLWAKMLSSLFGKNFGGLLTILTVLLLANLFRVTIEYFNAYLVANINNGLMLDLKSDLYKKILELPVKAFDEIRAGEIISRVHGDVSMLANIITHQFLHIIVTILKTIIIGIAVFTISWRLSIIIVIGLTVSYFISLKYGQILKSKTKEYKIINDHYFSMLSQSIAGIREVFSFGLKNKNFESNRIYFKQLKDKEIEIQLVNARSGKFSEAVRILSTISIYGIGAYYIYKESLSVEIFLVYISYSSQFYGSLMSLISINLILQQSLVSFERIFQLMDRFNYKEISFGNEKKNEIKGIVEFQNVDFNYDENKNILSDISFKINSGEKVAIVGKSGTGKSTIFNLLLRFYDSYSGRILIDDTEITKLDEDSLRKHISIVSQEPYLFNLSIMDNLLLLNDKATEEDVYAACKEAFVHDHIMSLPNQYDTKVGENGVNLSCGQKQRLAIARVLLKKSKIILFDEATSALDNESEYYIKKAIDQLSKNHTVLIIAHRLSTIIDADKIIVLKNGSIESIGNHETLLENSSEYSYLYRTEWEILDGLKQTVSH